MSGPAPCLDAVAAPIGDLATPLLRGLCALWGGSLLRRTDGYLDTADRPHTLQAIDALIRRGLAETYQAKLRIRVRLTDPRGRWFAATVIARVIVQLEGSETGLLGDGLDHPARPDIAVRPDGRDSP